MRSRSTVVGCLVLLITTNWQAAPRAQRPDPLQTYRETAALFRDRRSAQAIQIAGGWPMRDLTGAQTAIASDADGAFVDSPPFNSLR